MPEIHLRYKSKLSRKDAIDKITTYGMWGNHDFRPRPKNRGEVAKLLRSQGMNPDQMIEECRDYRTPVSCFERFIMNRGAVTTYLGGTFEIIDKESGEVISTLTEPGPVVFIIYLDKFDSARTYRDRAVEQNSFSEYLSAISCGITSIEAYISQQARRWNRQHPSDLLIDNKSNKVELLHKLEEWVPKMTGVSKMDKSVRVWNDFIKLKRVRDDIGVHPKCDSQVISYHELSQLINAFKFGIALMLGQLHLVFKEPIPNAVINAHYMPDVEVINSEENAG